MRRVTRFLILAGASALAACASQAPATSTGSPATSAGSGFHVVPDGYQREVINGSEQYCREDTLEGSRVAKKRVCLTWEQLQAEQRSNVEITRGSGPVN